MKITKEQLRTPEATAVIAAACYGLLTHLFAFNNILSNFDNIASQPGGYGGGVVLGRWFLEILGLFAEKIGLDYNLSVINGLIFVCLIAVSAGFLVSVLQIKSRKSAALIGMIMVAFPTVTATMIYRYTVVYYGIALLLSILAVWVFQRCKKGFALSVILITLSMGIYQAYVPMTIGLFVMLLTQQALRGEAEPLELVRRGLKECAALLLGLGLYFVCMKAMNLVTGTVVDEYQGLSSMGGISLGQLPELIWKAFSGVFTLALRDSYGIANRALMRLSYLALGLASVVMIGYILIVKIRKGIVALAVCILCLLFPVAVNFIEIMCPNSWVYTLMVYPWVLLAFMPLMLLECMPAVEGAGEIRKRFFTKCVGLVAALLAVYYGYYANVNYTALYYANRQIENYLNSVVIQVRMTEGFTPEKDWAILGDVNDPLLHSAWEEDAFYDGLGFTQYLLNQYSRNDWIENYIGYDIPEASEERIAELAESQEVRSMPCWPSEGSVKVIDDTVVVKFQELGS